MRIRQGRSKTDDCLIGNGFPNGQDVSKVAYFSIQSIIEERERMWEKGMGKAIPNMSYAYGFAILCIIRQEKEEQGLA
jgi:hypothetical protein